MPRKKRHKRRRPNWYSCTPTRANSNKTPDRFAQYLIGDLKKLDKGVIALTEFSDHVSNQHISNQLRKQIHHSIAQLTKLADALHKSEAVIIDFNALTHAK